MKPDRRQASTQVSCLLTFLGFGRFVSEGYLTSPDLLGMSSAYLYPPRPPAQIRTLPLPLCHYPPSTPFGAFQSGQYPMSSGFLPGYFPQPLTDSNYYQSATAAGIGFPMPGTAPMYPSREGLTAIRPFPVPQGVRNSSSLAVPRPQEPPRLSSPVQSQAGGGGSLDSLEDTPKNRSLLSGKAYKSRNVYKSVVRHLFSYVRKNRDDIIRILTEAGFSMQEVEHAFFKINYYNDLEREQSSKKNSQATIKKMVTKRTIYTYILRETLSTMLHNWGIGKLGKISEGNSAVYKDVCKYFYDETAKVLGQPAQGRTFLL